MTFFRRSKESDEPWGRFTVEVIQGSEGRFEKLEVSGSPEFVGSMLRQAIIGVGGVAEPVAELLSTELDEATAERQAWKGEA